MTDDKQILEIAKRAIEDGRKEDAKYLLRPLMKRNNTDAYILATKLASSQEQALNIMRAALQIDPDNARVQKRLEELTAIYKGDESKPLGELVNDSPTVGSKHLAETVELFQQYRWEVVSHRSNYAQFMRARGISAIAAFLLGLFMNVAGFIWLIFIYGFSEKEHSSISAIGNQLHLDYENDEVDFYYPEQFVVFLEEKNTSSFLAAMFYCFLGAIPSSIAIGILGWEYFMRSVL